MPSPSRAYFSPALQLPFLERDARERSLSLSLRLFLSFSPSLFLSSDIANCQGVSLASLHRVLLASGPPPVSGLTRKGASKPLSRSKVTCPRVQGTTVCVSILSSVFLAGPVRPLISSRPLHLEGRAVLPLLFLPTTVNLHLSESRLQYQLRDKMAQLIFRGQNYVRASIMTTPQSG